MRDAHRRILVVAILILAALVAVPSATAQENTTNASDVAPYYANNSTYIANESWMENRTDPTLENTTSLFTRLGTFIIGSGVRGQNVWAGPLVLGLVFIGAALGALAGNAGIVAGSVVAVAMLRGMVVVGLAPAWLWPVALFALGLVLTGIYIRSQR